MILSAKHKKHPELTRAQLGSFGRNEVAIYGTTCERIKLFVDQLRTQLAPFDIAYVDEDHSVLDSENSKLASQLQMKGRLTELRTPNLQNSFQNRIFLSQSDCIVVNGNHFGAQHQMVFCNEKKEQSLRKRKQELTNVVAIVREDESADIPEHIKEIVPNYQNIPTIVVSNEVAMKEFFQRHFLQPAPLKALIMAGGKSIRMGRDKSLIQHHDIPQFKYLTELLNQMKIMSFVSCREDQQKFYENENCSVMTDRIINCGPIGGIASAFMQEPDTAWLVLACDVLLLDESVLRELITSRDHSHVATSFINPFDARPEPLIAIWEPKAYPLIMQFIAQGYSCPRKVLMNGKVHLVHPTQPEKLANVNTPEDLEELKAASAK